MGGIRVTGLLMGSTSLDIKAGSVTKTIPVTVKSINLLSYGPAEGNGLTATVNTDGSLHVTGTATGQWRGLSWTFPCPVHGTVKLSGTSIAGLSFNIKCLDAKGQQLGDQMNLGNSVMAIPCRHRQPVPQRHLQRGHAHREGRRPPSPARIRRHRARVDATRQHEP